MTYYYGWWVVWVRKALEMEMTLQTCKKMREARSYRTHWVR
jgi:hypothetical protein